MKKILVLLIIGVFVVGCSSFARENVNGNYLRGKHNIEIKVKNYGVIKATLDADNAPITVTNFIELVNQGFYDNLTFHRIMSGFMIQGGDHSLDGTRKSTESIKGEFLANGVDNKIPHVRGTISMARADDYDSGSAQFFIMHEDNAGLDNYYAAFGTVTEGMEVVDKICKKAKPTDDNGTIKLNEQPVIEYIKVVE